MRRQTVIAGLLAVAVLALAWFLWPRGDSPGEPGPAPAPGGVAPATEALPEPEPAPLPGLEASDPVAREALAAAGVAGTLAAALEQENLVRGLVAAAAAVAEGRSPRRWVPFLEPAERFRTATEGGELIVDPHSFARYDGFARAVGALDSDAIGREYRRLEPLLQAAYEELGESGSFRVVLLQALDLLLATPVPTLPLRLEDRVKSYAYRDPELQALTPAQQHLLRLGPDNQRIVRDKLREVRERVGQLP